MISKSIILVFRSFTLFIIKQFLTNCRKISSVGMALAVATVSTIIPTKSYSQRTSSNINHEQLSQDETIAHWLSGFELEISERHFSRIIHLFDLNALESTFSHHRNNLLRKINQQQALTPMENKILKILNANIDNYLLNEKAYEALPSEVKNQLSDGLSLDKKSLHVEEKAIAIGSGIAKQPHTTPSLQASPSGLIIPNQALNQNSRKSYEPTSIIIGQKESYPQNEATDFRSFNAAHFESRSGWPELHRRWRAMSLTEKLSLIDFNFLDPRVQTTLLLTTEDIQSRKKTSYFKSRYPFKPEISSELFRSLDFELDGVEGHMSIEIKLAEPKPVNEMLKILHELSIKLGVQINKNITNSQNREDYALHIHLSDSKKISFKQWDQFWITYKNYVALKILSLNPKANAASISTYYETILLNLPKSTTRNELYLALHEKGLIRIIDSNHIELRELYDSPDIVINELSELLRTDFKSALERLYEQSNELLTKNPSLFKIIAERNPYFLMEFADDTNAEQIEALAKKAILKHLDSDSHQGHDLYLFLMKEFLGFSVPTRLKMAEHIFEASKDVMLRKMTLQFLVLPNWNKLSPDHPYFHSLYEKNRNFFHNSIDGDFLKDKAFSNHIEFKLFILKKFIADIDKNPTQDSLEKLKTLSFRDFPVEVRNSSELQELQMKINKLLRPYSYTHFVKSYMKELRIRNKATRCESLFSK